jgi:hypothetical protein
LECGEISEIRQGEMGSVWHWRGSDRDQEAFGEARRAGLVEFVPSHVESQ